MANAEIAQAVGRSRMLQAQETEAKFIITACQQCKRTLLGAARKNKIRIRTLDIVELFWESIQIELMNRKRWPTRLELPMAIVDWIERFHNRRRHSSLENTPPVEFEQQQHNPARIMTRAWDPEVLDAIWVTIEPLLPPPDNSHPLGCHRPLGLPLLAGHLD